MLGNPPNVTNSRTENSRGDASAGTAAALTRGSEASGGSNHSNEEEENPPSASAAQVDEGEEVVSASSIEKMIVALHEKYITPTKVLELRRIPIGSVVCGYVYDSQGSDNFDAVDMKEQKSRPRKRMKRDNSFKTMWHAVYLIDGMSMVKLFMRIPNREAMKKLPGLRKFASGSQVGKFLAVMIEKKAAVVTKCQTRLQRYEYWDKEVEIESCKTKVHVIDEDDKPNIPSHSLRDAFKVHQCADWAVVDSLIIPDDESFHKSITLAIMTVHDRDDMRKTRAGAPFFRAEAG